MLNPALKFRRRIVLKGMGAAAVTATLATPVLAVRPPPIRLAAVNDPLLHRHYRSGVMRAVAEINGAGGVRGRPILVEDFGDDQSSHRKCQMLQAAVQSAPHAILNWHTWTDAACVDILGTSSSPCCMSGLHCSDTDVALDLCYGRIVLEHVLEVGSLSVYRPEKLPEALNILAEGHRWSPEQRRLHIVSAPGLGEAWVTDKIDTRARGDSSAWTTIIHRTDPARDWTPLLQGIVADAPAVVLLDYRLTAELTGLPRFTPDYPDRQIVYLQYAPISQRPGEFPYRIFDDGFVWATLPSAYNDARLNNQGTNEFWRAQKTALSSFAEIYAFPAKGYAATKMLALAWQHAEPEDFSGVIDYVQTHAYLATSLFTGHDSWRGRI